MTVINEPTPGGAIVEIKDTGWAGCAEAELDRRRSKFTETAAELCGNKLLNEQPAEADVPVLLLDKQNSEFFLRTR